LKIEAEADVAFARLVKDAGIYWSTALPTPDRGKQIIVEAFHTELRVVLRNLTIANAIRRVEPARLVVLAGVDPRYTSIFADEGSSDALTRLARAYGADEIIDVHALVRSAPDVPSDDADPAVERIVRGTWCRLERQPEYDAGNAALAPSRAYARKLFAFYQKLFASPSVALVTSHVDYDQWELAVLAARDAGVPIVHTQQTGAAKAYVLFPENDGGKGTFRSELTPQIGEFFETRVWPRRDELHRDAELVAFRARSNLGRPSWWRAGGDSLLQMTSDVQRAQVRPFAAAAVGFDPATPVVACFNHATSDALGTNVEAFPNLADWFAETAAFAAQRPEVNWLFLDHPQQQKYDKSGFFAAMGARYAGQRHMRFMRSTELSKNQQWSLIDLATTVRGSVSNELPAYGIPVIQAGWSEWSACGLGQVVPTSGEYLAALETAIAAVGRGERLCTEEQVQRARLWHWLYRGGADVLTGLVPHWEFIPQAALFFAIGLHMRYVEDTFDPLFRQVEHMWREREPILTRVPMPAVEARAVPVSVPQARGEADAVQSAL